LRELEDLAAEPDERPVVMCEYSHAMGNSNGGIEDYWKLVHAEARLGGGFIWDWVDQGLLQVDGDGTRWWAFGGDYGDEPNDRNFNCNGLVDADRRPHPALAHVRWVYRPVEVRWADTAGLTVVIANRRSFTTTADLVVDLVLRADGEVVRRWDDHLVLAVDPLDEIVFGLEHSIAAEIVAASGGAREVHLGFHWRLRADRLALPAGSVVLPAGHEVAFDQLVVAAGRFPTNTTESPDRLATSASGGSGGATVLGDGSVELRAGGSELVVGPDGTPRYLVLAGSEIPVESGALSCWRPPTDNDNATFGDERLVHRWDRRGRPIPETSGTRDPLVEVRQSGVVAGSFRIAAGPGLSLRVTWLVGPDGDIGFEIAPAMDLDLPPLLRLGIDLELRVGYARIDWFGPGPLETYPDRVGGLEVARHSASVAEQFFAYARPQETGNHTRLRWLQLSAADGGHPPILAVGDPLFDGAALPYRPAEIESAEHLNELPSVTVTALRLDIAHSGLGTASCGPGIDDRHRVEGYHVRNRIIVRPGSTDRADPATGAAALAARPSSLGRHRRWRY
jgi:hypothetical protein